MTAKASDRAAPAALSSQVAAFCALLQREYAFPIGHPQAHDALRALESSGIHERERVRAALRTVLCGRVEEFADFERAFEAFFVEQRPGTKQPRPSHRHTRPDKGTGAGRPAGAAQPKPDAPRDDETAGSGAAAARRTIEGVEPESDSPYSFAARYSAAAAHAEAPEVGADEAEGMGEIARRLIARIRRGRAQRWVPQKHGARFDPRRTLRSSVRTAGDPVVLHRLGRPLRNPRFVVLIDGSGSMSKDVAPMLGFARALSRSTRRCATFVFSTSLREVTRELRRPGNGPLRLGELGEAWGGGTRIGSSLRTFVHEYGARLLSRETFVLIFSDGLDVDEIGLLERSLHDIRQRSAGIVWLNPHAGSAGYAPLARGMRAALPYVRVFAPAGNVAELGQLPDRL